MDAETKQYIDNQIEWMKRVRDAEIGRIDGEFKAVREAVAIQLATASPCSMKTMGRYPL